MTSTQVVEAYIERIEQIQPIVNCVAAECFKKALEVNYKLNNFDILFIYSIKGS